MGLRVICVVCIVVSLAISSCSGQVGHDSNHTIAINKAYDDWAKAANSKDIDKWSVFLAPNAVFLPPGNSALETVPEIKEYYLTLFEDPHLKFDCNQEFVEVSSSGDLAWSRGICAVTFSNPEGQPAVVHSKWAKVWIRMTDGTWKCKLNTWNTSEGDQ